MASVTADGQSFFIDGRRVWLVMGAIHYPRVPRGLWAKRLEAAREAGINCIETYVFWNEHESAPGDFDFEGDKGLRAFIQLCGEMGFYVVLRPGPYVCSERDFGGYPAWLLRLNDEARVKTEPVAFRQANGPVMQAVGRYMKAVYEQVKDLQVTGMGKGKTQAPRFNRPGLPAGGYCGEGGGPILLTQVENEWGSVDHAVGELYFTQLVRMLRDNGCSTPLIDCNNLVYRHPGVISCWNGNKDLSAAVRQLGTVQPDQPKIVAEFWSGWFDQWGREHQLKESAQQHLYRLAEILGAGGMPNQYMFHGGTNFGFSGGRTIRSRDCYFTTSYDFDAPLKEAGGKGGKFYTTKRICTFASQFGHVFAYLKPNMNPATAALDDAEAGVSIVHQPGERGDVVFVTKGSKCKDKSANVLLPNGLALPVYFGRDQAAWILLNTDLAGVATLDLTNLRPWAFVEAEDGDKQLVVYGPAGTDGVVMIDGAQHQFVVPKGKTPLRIDAGPVTLIVLNEQQVDAAALTDAGVALDPPKASKPRAPKITGWQSAPALEFTDPDRLEWQAIDGPAGHEKLHCDYGYGVYRMALTKTPAAGGKYLAPGSGDRLHVYSGDQLAGLIGPAAGGSDYAPVPMKLGRAVTVLCDNLGRFSFGCRVGGKRGVLDHLYRVKAARLPKMAVEPCEPCDPTVFSKYIAWGYMSLERPTSRVAEKLVFDVKLTVKSPLILDIQNQPDHWGMLANGEPATFCLAEGEGHHVTQVVLDPRKAPFKSGVNKIELVLSKKADPAVKPSDWLKLYEAEPITAGKTAWSFAPLSTPGSEAFGEPTTKAAGVPIWHKAEFAVARASGEVPLFLEPVGMTKGQIYLNGRNLCRFFMNTADGQPVLPQKRYYLPEPWLKLDGPNELLIFDEHGAPAEGCKLVYDAMGPYGDK